MTTHSALFVRVLPTMLLCLTLTGAADAAGPVVGWGYNHRGQATPPDAVNGVSGTATDIAAGEFHSCAIKAGRSKVVCWGDDYHGQATPPAAVNGVSGIASGIATGANHSCAIQAGTGDAVCWRGDVDGHAPPPDAVNGVSGTATDISVGTGHALAIALPEPSASTTLASGIAMLGVLHRRRRYANRR
jgi:hypothetical protein